MQTYGELEPSEVPQPAVVDVDKSTTVSHMKEGMQRGEEPQQIFSPSANISPESQAMYDIARLFRTNQECVSVHVCYSLLEESTREYLQRAFVFEN